MSIKKEKLLGFWKLVGLRTRESGSDWIPEKILGGMVAADEKNIVYYTKTPDSLIALSGTYMLDNDVVVTYIEIGNYPNLDGQVVTRKVIKLTDNELVATGIELETHREIELTFVRKK